jgi:hypothetical protein
MATVGFAVPNRPRSSQLLGYLRPSIDKTLRGANSGVTLKKRQRNEWQKAENRPNPEWDHHQPKYRMGRRKHALSIWLTRDTPCDQEEGHLH